MAYETTGTNNEQLFKLTDLCIMLQYRDAYLSGSPHHGGFGKLC